MAQFLSSLLSTNNTLLLSTVNFTATGGQQSFTTDYTAPFVEAYLNGVKLVKDVDFLASNNTSVFLTTGASQGDSLEVVKLKAGNIKNDQVITAGTNLNGGGSISGNPTINLDTSIALDGPITAPIVTANSFVGPLTGTASVATTVSLVATNTTDATHYPVFVDAATGNENPRTDTGLTYNPSSGILASTDFNSTSDIALKENLSPVENALNLINNLNGYTFDWKDKNRSSIGVTAQDVEQHLPQLVTTIDDYKTVNYNGLIGVLIEAIKELNNKLENR